MANHPFYITEDNYAQIIDEIFEIFGRSDWPRPKFKDFEERCKEHGLQSYMTDNFTFNCYDAIYHLDNADIIQIIFGMNTLGGILLTCSEISNSTIYIPPDQIQKCINKTINT